MRALREWAPGEQLAAARAADARALDVVAEDHRPAQGPTPPWLWVHQKEQWDDPAPAGWYVVHECSRDWSRRVAVASTREGALDLGRANAWAWPYPAHVPRAAVRYCSP